MSSRKLVHIRRHDAGDVCGGSFSSANIMRDLLPRLEIMRKTTGNASLSGLSSGFQELDRMVGGFHPGELIVVAGRPCMGAQQFVWQIAMHVATELNETVAYFSTTQSRTFLLQNMTAYAAQVDWHQLRENQLNEQEWESYTSAAQKIANAPLNINDSSADPRVIRSEAKCLCESNQPPKLIVIDSIPSQSDSSSAVALRMSNMSADIYRIARYNGIPVIALAEVSRDVESRKCKYPMLADIASADGLQWYADTVISLYRNAVYAPETKEKDTTHISILKSFYGCIGGFDMQQSKGGWVTPV
jgi:replicative DNA helicase